MNSSRNPSDELEYIYDTAAKLPWDDITILPLTLQSVGFDHSIVNRFLKPVKENGAIEYYEELGGIKIIRYLPAENGTNLIYVELNPPVLYGYFGEEKPFDNLTIKLIEVDEVNDSFKLLDLIKYPSGKNKKILEKEEIMYRALLDMFSAESNPWELSETNKTTINIMMNENLPSDARGPIVISDVEYLGTFKSEDGIYTERFNIRLEMKKKNTQRFYQIGFYVDIKYVNPPETNFIVHFITLK